LNSQLLFHANKVVTTIRIDCDFTAVRLPFDCNSTALRTFDDLRYDPRAGLPVCGLLHCGLNK